MGKYTRKKPVVKIIKLKDNRQKRKQTFRRYALESPCTVTHLIPTTSSLLHQQVHHKLHLQMALIRDEENVAQARQTASWQQRTYSISMIVDRT